MMIFICLIPIFLPILMIELAKKHKAKRLASKKVVNIFVSAEQKSLEKALEKFSAKRILNNKASFFLSDSAYKSAFSLHRQLAIQTGTANKKGLASLQLLVVIVSY